MARPRSLISLLTLAATAAPAQAQTAPGSRLDPVVVTATRTPQRLSEVLADMTVLTRDDIERQAHGGLADLLRRQAGFEMVRNGGPGANTSVFVRGADARHTLVLLDGMRIDSQSTGGASWQNIPLAQIERVEIVRGPASAVYGSDAIGGVVQIFTRKGDGAPQLDLGVGGGNRGLAKADASVRGLVGKAGAAGAIDYAFSAAAERSDGFNTRPSADPAYVPDIDGYRSRDLSARLGAQLGAGQRVELVGLKSRIDSQYDASAKPKPGVDDRNLNEARAVRGSWLAQWGAALNTELSVGESVDHYETQPNAYMTDTCIRSYAFSGGYQFGQGRLTGSVERREDRLVNSDLSRSATAGRAERHQDSFGLGYLWASGPLSLQLNGRHDDDSEFGGSNTGALAAGYQLSPGWRVQASAGTAFRAPTLYQRFSQYGNAALVPEKSRNVEAGLLYTRDGHEFGITAYRNQVRQLIVFGPANAALCPDEFGCYDNVGQARLQGVNLKGAAQLGVVRLSASVDLQAPKDVTDSAGYKNYGKLLARRSKTHGSLRADTALGAWTLGAEVLASGKRFNEIANTTRLGGYALLGLDAQYAFNPQLRLQLKLDNAFDRAYQTANGYASAPRQAFVGLRYSPKL